MKHTDSQTITVQQRGATVSPVAKGRHYQRIIEQTEGLQPLRTAVVHPVDVVSLGGAVEAARARLIVPVLVGSEMKKRGRPSRRSSI